MLVEESPCEYSIDIEYSLMSLNMSHRERVAAEQGGVMVLVKKKCSFIEKKKFLDHDLTHQQNVNVRVLSVQNLCTFALNM